MQLSVEDVITELIVFSKKGVGLLCIIIIAEANFPQFLLILVYIYYIIIMYVCVHFIQLTTRMSWTRL